MKKKIVAFALASIMVAGALTACGTSVPLNNTVANSAASSVAKIDTGKSMSQDGLTNDLQGLVTYLRGNGVISVGNVPQQMFGDQIGAVQTKVDGQDTYGLSYSENYKASNASNKNLFIEVYQLDDSALAQETRAGILKDGTIPTLDATAPASISDNQKFVMVIVDTQNDDDQAAYISFVVNLFKGFNPSETSVVASTPSSSSVESSTTSSQATSVASA